VLDFSNVPSLPTIASSDAAGTAVRPTVYQYEVAQGRRANATTWNKWGYNPDVDTGTETIWAAGGLFTALTNASTFSVVSTSTSDIGTSTGVASVIIYGIDSTRTSTTEVVTLNGTTPVSTVGTFFGVNRVAIYAATTTATSAGFNNGVITVVSGALTQAIVPAQQGSTQQAIFFTQAGHTSLLDWAWFNINKLAGGTAPKVTIKCFVKSFVSNGRYEVFRANIDTSVENTIELRPSQPFVVGEKSIIEFQATTDTDNTIVSMRLSLIEIKN